MKNQFYTEDIANLIFESISETLCIHTVYANEKTFTLFKHFQTEDDKTPITLSTTLEDNKLYIVGTIYYKFDNEVVLTYKFSCDGLLNPETGEVDISIRWGRVL